MDYALLMAHLAQETGVDLSAAVHSGSCSIMFDARLEVKFEAGEDDERRSVAHLHASLGLAPVSAEALLARVLQLHWLGLATGNGTFGFDPNLRNILFFRTLDLSRYSLTETMANVTLFVNHALHWREQLPLLATDPLAVREKTHDGHAALPLLA